MSAVDNEVHFVLCCPSFDDLRYEFIEPKYFNNPCEFRLALFLATQNERALKKHSTEEKTSTHTHTQTISKRSFELFCVWILF